MVGKLRPGEAKSLEWLGLSSSDRTVAAGLTSISLTNLEEGWLNLEWEEFSPAAAYYETINSHFKILLDLRGHISREEVQEIIDGSHESYSNEGVTDAQRLRFLFRDLASGDAVPQKLYEKWLSLLEEADGDSLKAMVLAEFHRPEVES